MTWEEFYRSATSDYGWTTGQVLALVVIVVLVIGIIAALLYALWKRSSCNWAAVDAEVALGGIGKVKINPSYEDVQIAHKAWVELVTRKAGLPFDEEHDVIAEIYRSWYELFREMRALAKEVPAHTLRRSKDSQQLVTLLVDALNLGLRPHLTKWQAKFMHWYDSALKKSPEKNPQDIQKEYPHYQDLVDDLKQVNRQIVEYAAVIKQIAQGCQDKTERV